jgi:trans-aconitate 2-methyltransferase
MVGWDPTTYLDFAAERARPFHDLLARIGGQATGGSAGGAAGQVARDTGEVRRVADLGCGPGGLTASLATVWPQARVLGVDSSPEMIERAAAYAQAGRVEFELADLRDWHPAQPVDVIVTNATLQWVPGHLELLGRWVASAVRPGGWIALQVPGNLADPLHVLLREVAGSPRWRDRLGQAEHMRAVVPDPLGYAEVLAGAGCRVDAWETTYLHILDPEGRFGPDAVLAWTMGTALRPVLDLLPDKGSREAFIDEYAARLRSAYPRRPWGTPLPFRRVFAVAQVGSAV